MHARDSSGRQVSLLNDELPRASRGGSYYCASLRENFSLQLSDAAAEHHFGMERSESCRSNSSSPLTPGLSRADSYDSNANDPLSPITPISIHNPFPNAIPKDQPHVDYRERMPSHDDYTPQIQYQMLVRPEYLDRPTTPYREPQPYELQHQKAADREPHGSKRYPCRYRESHGCEKTFTTSGHASRHSKIHTAEKAVCCVYPGCQKKFTRADNMKQHLETHSKERGRHIKTGTKTLTSPASIQKSIPARPSRPSSRSTDASSTVEIATPLPLDPALFPADASASHTASPSFELFRSSSLPDSLLLAQPIPSPRGDISQNGLDALATAAAVAACT